MLLLRSYQKITVSKVFEILVTLIPSRFLITVVENFAREKSITPALGSGRYQPSACITQLGPGPANGHDLAIYLRQSDLSTDKLPPFEFSCQHTIDSRYTRTVCGMLTVVWANACSLSPWGPQQARAFTTGLLKYWTHACRAMRCST